MSGLSIRNLHKSFGTHPVLTGVDLDVPEGSLSAILGPSGSGKTTLLRVLAGFERADQGTVTVGGTLVEGDGRHIPPERRHIGYVPQEGALFPHLTVAANIGFGLARSRRRARVGELLEMIGLSRYGARYPHELSGGEQQRVALARALATSPRVILLDEPFSSLDAGLRASVRQDVARLLQEAEATAILVTHDQDEALSMASHVALLRNGRFIQHDTALNIYSHPADADVARFVGDANLLTGVARDGRAITSLGSHRLAFSPYPDGTPLLVLIRPEQINVIDQTEASVANTEDGWIPGTITSIDYHGHDTVITIAAGPPDTLDGICSRIPGASTFAPGALIALKPADTAVTAWTASP